MDTPWTTQDALSWLQQLSEPAQMLMVLVAFVLGMLALRALD